LVNTVLFPACTGIWTKLYTLGWFKNFEIVLKWSSIYGGFVIPNLIIILSWFFNSLHKDINNYEIFEPISLPYAPVSYEVIQIYLTPYFMTEATLEVIAYGA